ncbi:MAG TPA: hypothetical protein VET30_10410 [Pseudoxanthomonas sp.]|nr:hypothetical protein [Pseudoxanthomonas sp.]
MGTIRDIRATPQDVMLDIDAELRHWRGCYRESAFHSVQREFDDYIPTLKFGYDVYLLNYQKDLDGLMQHLRQRYERSVPEWQRLDWTLGEAIVRATWKRMQSGQAWRPMPHPPGAPANTVLAM